MDHPYQGVPFGRRSPLYGVLFPRRFTLGVPPHDLRTLAADYLRRHDPASAPAIVAAHLGHGTEAAGAEYRALCEGAAATRVWRATRETVADGLQDPKPPLRHDPPRPWGADLRRATQIAEGF